jgi:hypothetical protein
MKTNRKIDIHLYNIYKDLYTNEDEINTAVKDAKRAFTLIQHDALYNKGQQ